MIIDYSQNHIRFDNGDIDRLCLAFFAERGGNVHERITGKYIYLCVSYNTETKQLKYVKHNPKTGEMLVRKGSPVVETVTLDCFIQRGICPFSMAVGKDCDVCQRFDEENIKHELDRPTKEFWTP